MIKTPEGNKIIKLKTQDGILILETDLPQKKADILRRIIFSFLWDYKKRNSAELDNFMVLINTMYAMIKEQSTWKAAAKKANELEN